VPTDLLFWEEIPKSGINNSMKTFREYINLIESAQQGEPLAEGVMDRLRRIYMGLVYDRPWGTPDSEFLAQWQQEIKAQLGKDIDLDTLARLQQNFRERGQTMMARGDWADYDREMGIREQGVAGGSSSQIKGYSGPPEGYTFSRVQQKNYDMLVDILARNGMKFTRIDAETYPGRRSYYDRIGKSTPIMLTSFIGRSPALEWYKYEGQTAGGGTNTVKVGGKKMKLTDFLRLKPEQQDALLKSGPGQGVSEGSDEKYSYRVTFDDGTHNTVAIPVAKIFQGGNSAKDLITRHFARKGRTVKDIEMMFRPDSVQEGDQALEDTQQVEQDPVARITQLHQELSRR
jgi:hypothetical protein